MKLPYRVLLVYNEPEAIYENYSGKTNFQDNNFNSEDEHTHFIDLIVDILKEKYLYADKLPIGKNLSDEIIQIKKINPNLIFNLVESIKGKAYLEGAMAGLYEVLNINYTGNKPDTLYNCLNKKIAKDILISHGIETPKSILIDKNDKIIKKNFDNLYYPVIAKLNEEDASIGLSEHSICYDSIQLFDRITFLLDNYKQNIIVEEYIDGRELNVAILGEESLPISEIDFSTLDDKYPKIVTYEAKWVVETDYYKNTIPMCPAKLSPEVEKKTKEIALKSFKALNCRDYARVDIRLTKDNIPLVIEVNPNPDISPTAGFARAASAAGLSYSDMIFKISQLALNRGNI